MTYKKFALSTVCVAAISLGVSQAWSAPGDWVQVNGNAGNSKYSPLNQITPANVSRLAQSWSHPGGGGSMTPIAIAGVLYYPSGAKIFALDGDSGKELWTTDLSTLIPSK